MSFIQDSQGYAQWNQWGQVPQNYWQAQIPWGAGQPCSSWQAQGPWNALQPQGGWQGQDPWNELQPRGGSHNAWNMYETAGFWPGQQQDTAQWLDDPETLFADPFAVPAEVPSTLPETAQPGQAHRSKAINLILNILTFCFVVFLLAGSTMFAFSNNETKSLFGYRFYNVLTPSMQPFFKPGDLIFVKLVDPSQVKAGDVVTFSPSASSTAFLTHRVVELLPAEENRPARMVTKGDHNNAADPPVGLNAVIGVHVFTIPKFGRVIDMMRSNLLLVCVCFGAVFLLLVVLRAYFAARKQEKAGIHALT